VKEINKKLLFLSIPRSGSTFLCDILSKHGDLGFPEEWFNPKFIEIFSQHVKPISSPKSLSTYCDFVVHKSATQNGCFSLNLHLPSYIWWLAKGIDWIDTIGFDHIYFIYRRDKYAQTYSWAIANKSKEWRKTTEKGHLELPKDVTFEFMFQLLSKLLHLEWQYETSLKSRVKRELQYERFCQNINSAVEQICIDAGVAFHADNLQDSKYKIQRTDYDQQLLAQFRAYMQHKLQDI